MTLPTSICMLVRSVQPREVRWRSFRLSIVDRWGGCHKERVRSTRLAQERRKTGGDVCILADCASEGISRMPEGQPRSDRVAHSTPFSLAQARAWSEACLMASSPKPSGLNVFCFTFPSEV